MSTHACFERTSTASFRCFTSKGRPAAPPIQLRLSSLRSLSLRILPPQGGKTISIYTLTHFPSLAEDFTAASMKAMPLTPSSTVGNMTAGSSFFFDRAARIAVATSV
jgi:hypothetical protein